MGIFKDNDVVRYIGTSNSYLQNGRHYVIAVCHDVVSETYIQDAFGGTDFSVEFQPELFELIMRTGIE